MQAHTLALLQEESDGFATSQQRFLNKVTGLVKNVKVFVKSVVNFSLSYLFINVTSSIKELVQNNSVLTLLTLNNAKIKACYKAFCRATGTLNQLRTL
jgi:uncharacterized membrane protein